MKNKNRILVFVFLSFVCSLAYCNEPVRPILRESDEQILKQSATLVNLAPFEQRDAKYVKFLSASVKITVKGAAGSGTICYYSHDSNLAYIISCGHLWEGNRNFSNLGEKEKVKVTTWYHNDLKLENPKVYDGEALFWSNERGYDTSLIRFKPDWIPNYFPIAKEFKEKNGFILNSLGCDGGREVARYEVKFKEINYLDLITDLNSPRPGRSGGGLLTDDGKLVGVCWGTSDVHSGQGIGYFTPISSIKKVFVSNGHEWLLNINGELESIIIYDWDNPKNKYNKDYIPIPNFLLF